MVKVWDVNTGRCTLTLTGHVGPVTCVGLADSRMVTGGEDCIARLHCFKNLEKGGEVVGHYGGSGEVEVTPMSSGDVTSCNGASDDLVFAESAGTG
jgi:F-box/WD-40 domain protein MET30